MTVFVFYTLISGLVANLSFTLNGVEVKEARPQSYLLFSGMLMSAD